MLLSGPFRQGTLPLMGSVGGQPGQLVLLAEVIVGTCQSTQEQEKNR